MTTIITGGTGYLGGALFFKRKSPAARRRVLKQALACMKAGQPLHVYPEGTRVGEGQRVRIHLGLVEACYSAGIPVMPTALMDTEIACGRDLFMRPFTKVRVSYLPLVEPSDFQDSEAFAKACWQNVLDEVEILRSTNA